MRQFPRNHSTPPPHCQTRFPHPPQPQSAIHSPTPPHPTQRLRHRLFATPSEPSAGFSLSSLLFTLSSPLDGRAYSALPCAGAEPPQRPLSYNMPRRPGADIGHVPNRKNSANPPPASPTKSPQGLPLPSPPTRAVFPLPLKRNRRGRPCACPRLPNQRTISPTARKAARTKNVDSGPNPAILTKRTGESHLSE